MKEVNSWICLMMNCVTILALNAQLLLVIVNLLAHLHEQVIFDSDIELRE